MPADAKSGKKELAEHSDRITKTKKKLLQQNDLFLDLETIGPKEKSIALKNISHWIALHHNLREKLTSQSMGLFKNNEESAEPSKVIKQMQADLQGDLTEQK